MTRRYLQMLRFKNALIRKSHELSTASESTDPTPAALTRPRSDPELD